MKLLEKRWHNVETKFHENRVLGLLLTFIGGMMDSYTYIHYGAFASAQTGNIVLAMIQAFDGMWSEVGKKLLSTCFFLVGIYLTNYLIDYFQKKRLHFWRLAVLYFEAFIFWLVSLQVIQHRPSIVTIMIAFTAAIQWVSFDKINGLAYTNLFTTGNLKGMATSLYTFRKTKNTADRARLVHFSSVVAAFISGVVVSVGCYHLFGGRSVLAISLLFIVIAGAETFFVWKFYRVSQFGKN